MPMNNSNNANQRPQSQPNQQPNTQSAFSRGSDPFAQAGSNIFDSLAAKQQQGGGDMARPPSGAGDMPSGAQQHPNMSSTPPNGQAPQSGVVPNSPAGQQGSSPLDNYVAKPDNTPNNQAPAATPEAQTQEVRDMFNLGMDDFTKYTSEANYIDSIDEEVATKALQGDMGALQQLLNGVARSAVSQSAFMSTRIAGEGVNRRLDQFGQKVPGMINEHSTKQLMVNDSTMNHPAMRPMVDSATAAMKAQHPQATPQELHTKVREYMNTMAQVLNSNQQEPAAPTQQEAAASNMQQFFES